MGRTCAGATRWGPTSRTGGGTAISPDGCYVVFAVTGAGSAKSSLFRWPLHSAEAHPSEGTVAGNFRFWSRDSKAVGFSADGKLKRVDIAGDAAVVLCDSIALRRVQALGGAPTPATHADFGRRETEHGLPRFLPEANAFCFSWVAG